MKRISMIAVQDFEWDGVEASVLHRRRHARFITNDDSIDEPEPLVAPVPLEASKEAIVKTRRPRRRRRDISTSPHTKADA
jgi:hypothetical protein